ncbi:hypothetical protein DFJ73DRAFT_919462 [Zopfochytrium polystomum]|nr:hypothetical protein DFJ73DRAFT_919462 [Zopfochytrium polystomum]
MIKGGGGSRRGDDGDDGDADDGLGKALKQQQQQQLHQSAQFSDQSAPPSLSCSDPSARPHRGENSTPSRPKPKKKKRKATSPHSPRQSQSPMSRFDHRHPSLGCSSDLVVIFPSQASSPQGTLVRTPSVPKKSKKSSRSSREHHGHHQRRADRERKRHKHEHLTKERDGGASQCEGTAHQIDSAERQAFAQVAASVDLLLPVLPLAEGMSELGVSASIGHRTAAPAATSSQVGDNAAVISAATTDSTTTTAGWRDCAATLQPRPPTPPSPHRIAPEDDPALADAAFEFGACRGAPLFGGDDLGDGILLAFAWGLPAGIGPAVAAAREDVARGGERDGILRVVAPQSVEPVSRWPFLPRADEDDARRLDRGDVDMTDADSGHGARLAVGSQCAVEQGATRYHHTIEDGSTNARRLPGGFAPDGGFRHANANSEYGEIALGFVDVREEPPTQLPQVPNSFGFGASTLSSCDAPTEVNTPDRHRYFRKSRRAKARDAARDAASRMVVDFDDDGGVVNDREDCFGVDGFGDDDDDDDESEASPVASPQSARGTQQPDDRVSADRPPPRMGETDVYRSGTIAGIEDINHNNNNNNNNNNNDDDDDVAARIYHLTEPADDGASAAAAAAVDAATSATTGRFFGIYGRAASAAEAWLAPAPAPPPLGSAQPPAHPPATPPAPSTEAAAAHAQGGGASCYATPEADARRVRTAVRAAARGGALRSPPPPVAAANAPRTTSAAAGGDSSNADESDPDRALAADAPRWNGGGSSDDDGDDDDGGCGEGATSGYMATYGSVARFMGVGPTQLAELALRHAKTARGRRRAMLRRCLSPAGSADGGGGGGEEEEQAGNCADARAPSERRVLISWDAEPVARSGGGGEGAGVPRDGGSDCGLDAVRDESDAFDGASLQLGEWEVARESKGLSQVRNIKTGKMMYCVHYEGANGRDEDGTDQTTQARGWTPLPNLSRILFS